MSSSHTITQGDLVLVTGASGYIAAHTAREYLKQGFNVRGTVRSDDKGEYLRNLFKDLPGKFTYVIVKDIAQEGAFDEAVKGVDAVAHTASPFSITKVEDPQDLINPAVQGTIGILKSVQKNNPSIKRIVVTSSVVAIMSVISNKPPHHYTEADWNVDSIPYIEEHGTKDGGSHAYFASKTFAEKALWDFIEKEKPSWDVATINPSLVFGEVIHQCDKPESLNQSVAMFYHYATGQVPESDLLKPIAPGVDVKDVAFAHVRAHIVPEASGQRFILSNGSATGQDIVDSIHKNFPDANKNIPVGTPGAGEAVNKEQNYMDGSKAARVLGIKYMSLEDSFKETFVSLRQRFGTI
ncbi:hypothetical protein L202_04044 [Cryptococcus amylolentus CBS 6039]|uniref:NAD-dependent epimerase/dehydratase domain-containing protein n=2 Tax=Cryptococcus amylolentus TaxID=104669 RepID=A0A1E3HQJ2_9TREE|nr:hypothetical protein L202_04044 [Cryptococcus amylolentus CBS 6039]ODN78405.1 hypothetical protein L202_04044 [Cryptococcus amylolentus CBS 6039]ODO07004.1 hypothetical protein I350_04370 [Cryptococcus amylolentus CBS 6273]